MESQKGRTRTDALRSRDHIEPGEIAEMNEREGGQARRGGEHPSAEESRTVAEDRSRHDSTMRDRG